MTISVGGFIKAILLVSSFAAASKSGSEQAEFLRVNPMADVVTLHFSDYQLFERIMLVHDTVRADAPVALLPANATTLSYLVATYLWTITVALLLLNLNW